MKNKIVKFLSPILLISILISNIIIIINQINPSNKIVEKPQKLYNLGFSDEVLLTNISELDITFGEKKINVAKDERDNSKLLFSINNNTPVLFYDNKIYESQKSEIDKYNLENKENPKPLPVKDHIVIEQLTFLTYQSELESLSKEKFDSTKTPIYLSYIENPDITLKEGYVSITAESKGFEKSKYKISIDSKSISINKEL